MFPNSDAQSTHSLPSQQATTHSGYVTSHCSHTSVASDEVGSDSLFFDSRGETQFGSPGSVKDGSDDGEWMVRITQGWKRWLIVGPGTRFILYPAQSISSVKVGQWAKTRGSYHTQEDEPDEQTVQDASMYSL